MSSTASTTAADEDVFANASVDNNMSTKHTNETSHVENSVGSDKETRSIPAPAQDKVKSNDSHSRNVATITGDSDEPIYVSELGQDDVLMGRGAPIINYIGNVRFRELVGTRKTEYLGTARHQVKDGIAKSIIDEIENRGGRFLRKVDAVKVASIESSENLDHDDEGNDLKMPSTSTRTSSLTKLYQIAEYDAVLEKVKQALRDKDATKRQGDIKENYDDRNVASAQPPNIGQYDALLGRNQSTHSLLYDAVVGNNRATMSNADDMLGYTPQLSTIGSISESRPWILHHLQQRLARENIRHLAQRHLQNQQGLLPYNSNLHNHQALQYLTSRHRNESYAQSSMFSVNPFLASSPSINVTLDDLLRQNQRNDFLPDPYSLGTARNTARLLYDSITSRNASRDDSDQLVVLSLLAQQQRQRRESAVPDFAMAARQMLLENRQLPTAMLPILGQESQSIGDSSRSAEQVGIFNANGLGIASRLNLETAQHRQSPTTMLSILEQQSQNVTSSAETIRLNHTEDNEHKSEISVDRSPTNRSKKEMAIKPSSPKIGSESLDGDREQMKPELLSRKKRQRR